MKITYDKVADALYIYFKKGKVSKSKEINNNMIADFDKKGGVVGLEVLFVSSWLKTKNIEKDFKKGIPMNIISKLPAMA